MKLQVVLVLAVGLLLAAEKPTKEEGTKKAKGLGGTWMIVSITQDGKNDDKAKDRKVIFEGKNITVKAEKGDHKVTFKIDQKKKTIDLTPADGPEKDKTFKGIYELKKGELKICFARPGKDRPTEFTSEAGSGRMLVVLKRGKSE
jgi:uncharacterized protein (TIGR03067 family)